LLDYMCEMHHALLLLYYEFCWLQWCPVAKCILFLSPVVRNLLR